MQKLTTQKFHKPVPKELIQRHGAELNRIVYNGTRDSGDCKQL